MCRGNGQTGLAAVEQAFYEDIVGLFTAIEHQLHITGLTGLPALVAVLHLIGVFWIAVGAVDAHP